MNTNQETTMTEKREITEESGAHKAWYEEARKVTAETLPAFVAHLLNDYHHDYGTICHAVAAAALAGAMAVEHDPAQGGITGFQAGAVMWEFLRVWDRIDCPARLVKYEDLLYPQYDERFREISASTWKWAQERAASLLAGGGAHPAVRAHWESIVGGTVPFGLRVETHA
jgi:hypothetical protein